jgi:hypothetical protein
LFFIFILLLYTVLYKNFLKKNKIDVIKRPIEDFEHKIKSIKRVFIALVLFNLLAKYNLFLYILNNRDISSWFLYKFVEMQGRDPILRILSTATQIYLLYYAFLMFAVVKRWKFFVVITYLLIICLEVLTGSRSVLLGVIFNIGLCIFYFRSYFNPLAIQKFSRRGLIFSSLALVAFIIVSAFYSENYSLIDGFSIMINRFFAAGDGLEYYMNYNGLVKIKSGIGEFIYSIFGIYIKRFTGEGYKNVGQQLSELVLGDLEFTQGPNYTLLLQVMVIGFQYFLFYVPFIAFVSAKLRAIRFKSINFTSLSYFLSATSFLIVIDLEFWVLNFVSGLLFFFIIIYPLSNFSLKVR